MGPTPRNSWCHRGYTRTSKDNGRKTVVDEQTGDTRGTDTARNATGNHRGVEAIGSRNGTESARAEFADIALGPTDKVGTG